MVDRITRTVSQPDVSLEMEPFIFEISLLVRFKAGTARGGMPFYIRIEKPNGESQASPRQNLFFEGDADRGVDVIIPMALKLAITGLYWLDIMLQEVRVTRVPFRVIYNPISRLQRPAGANPELPPES